MWGGGLSLGGQPCPHPKGMGSQRSPNFGVHCYLWVHLWRRTTSFHMVLYMGMGLVFRRQSRPHRKGTRPSAPQFWRLSCIYA